MPTQRSESSQRMLVKTALPDCDDHQRDLGAVGHHRSSQYRRHSVASDGEDNEFRERDCDRDEVCPLGWSTECRGGLTSDSGEASTTYQPVFVTDRVTATSTTYTDSASIAPSSAASVDACPISSLSLLSGSALASACSCLGHSPSTTTSTRYITSTVPFTTTSYPSGVSPQTTTAYYLARLVITTTLTPTQLTIPLTATLTSSTTTTLALPAPRFTQTFGPKSGCTNIGVFNSTSLDTSIADRNVAAEECEAICKQEPRCKFLWVQRMLADYGALEPRFECGMNGEVFDEGRDLVCGGGDGVHGEACGFAVLARGVPSIA